MSGMGSLGRSSEITKIGMEFVLSCPFGLILQASALKGEFSWEEGDDES